MTCLDLTLCIAIVSRPMVGSAQSADQAPAAPRWTVDQMMTVRNVDNVQFSADGRRVLFAITRAVMTDERSEYVSQLHVADADGSNERQLTPLDRSVAGAQWSPDGRWIAYVSRRSGTSQVWLLPAQGGEPHALTIGRADAFAFKWSPSGSQIAFLRPDPVSDAEQAAGKAKDDAFVVGGNVRNSRLWVVGVAADGSANGVERPLTSAAINVGDSFGGGHFDWSPDGSSIAFVQRAADDWPSSSLAMVDVASGAIKPMPDEAGAQMAPLFSPDGRYLAYLSSADTWGSMLDVHVLDLRSGKPRTLAETPARLPRLLAWSSEGDCIYFTEPRGMQTRLSALPVSGGQAQDLETGEAVLSSIAIAPGRRMVAFVRQTMTDPPEAFVSPLDRLAPVQISRANVALPRHPLPRTERVQWTAPDGALLEGLLTYPIGYESGRRYPLVLVVHAGGSAFQNTFLASPFASGLHPVAAFAERGYAVLRPNSRGGVLPGYAPAYRLPWFKVKEKAYADLMSGVDYVIGMGVADGARLGVTGWSNGGLSVAWITTQTSRFKAAIVGAGFPNLISQAAVNPAIPTDLGAEPWSDPAAYIAHSPLFHVASVTTPTLILHGERDEWVPIGQAHEWRQALKRRGVRVEMVVYPRGGHEPQEPKQVLDIARRTLEWMDLFLKKAGSQPR